MLFEIDRYIAQTFRIAAHWSPFLGSYARLKRDREIQPVASCTRDVSVTIGEDPANDFVDHQRLGTQLQQLLLCHFFWDVLQPVHHKEVINHSKYNPDSQRNQSWCIQKSWRARHQQQSQKANC